MFCPNCGNELPEEARFCNKCGKEIRIDTGTITEEAVETIKMKPVDKEPRISETGATVKKTKKKVSPLLVIACIPVILVLCLILFVVICAFYEPGINIAKGIKFGMSEDAVDRVLQKNFDSLIELAVDDNAIVIPRDRQMEEFDKYYGDVSPYIVQIQYIFDGDKLCRVEYDLTDEIIDMKDLCHGLDVFMDESLYSGDGYYTTYQADNFAEFHVKTGRYYEDDNEKYYAYVEPTYELKLFGKHGHKHHWDEQHCYAGRVCTSCGKGAPGYRYHKVGADGICEACNDNVGIPLIYVNLSDYFSLVTNSKNVKDQKGNWYIYSHMKVRPLSDDYTFSGAHFNVYADIEKIDGMNKTESRELLGEMSVDYNGSGDYEREIYNVDGVTGFYLDAKYGRVHLPSAGSPTAEDSDPSTVSVSETNPDAEKYAEMTQEWLSSKSDLTSDEGNKPYAAVKVNGKVRLFVECIYDGMIPEDYVIGFDDDRVTEEPYYGERCYDRFITDTGYVTYYGSSGAAYYDFAMLDLETFEQEYISVDLNNYSYKMNERQLSEAEAEEYVSSKIGEEFHFGGDVPASWVAFDRLSWFENAEEAINNPYVLNTK